MKVDHYTATVDVSDGADVLDWLMEALPPDLSAQPRPDFVVKRNAYQTAIPVMDADSVLAIVRWGGNGDGTSIELKGSVADQTFGLLRARFPDHSCSRLDVAVDGTAAGLFDAVAARLFGLVEARPVNRRPRIDQHGDWITRAPGTSRTVYFGGGDPAMVVLYEKGREREIVAGMVEQDQDWTRLELRLTHRRREGKRALAAIQPGAAWGMAPWAAEFLEAFQGLRPAPVKLPARIPSDDRAWMALLAQYGPLLRRRSAGDWATLGELLGYDLEQQTKLRQGKLK